MSLILSLNYSAIKSTPIYNTSARHERHECNTSATRERHEQHKSDTSATRVLHEQHECDTSEKKNDFDNCTSKSILSHSYIYYMANERLQGVEEFGSR